MISLGYDGETNIIPRMSTALTVNDGLKFIRHGTLQKYEDSKNAFEDCQLKLHHDYLTYYKNKSKGIKHLNLEKKVSFLPLENAIV